MMTLSQRGTLIMRSTFHLHCLIVASLPFKQPESNKADEHMAPARKKYTPEIQKYFTN
jgi:hypothetical protein